MNGSEKPSLESASTNFWTDDGPSSARRSNAVSTAVDSGTPRALDAGVPSALLRNVGVLERVDVPDRVIQ
jgi:hypothetical protein